MLTDELCLMGHTASSGPLFVGHGTCVGSSIRGCRGRDWRERGHLNRSELRAVKQVCQGRQLLVADSRRPMNRWGCNDVG